MFNRNKIWLVHGNASFSLVLWLTDTSIVASLSSFLFLFRAVFYIIDEGLPSQFQPCFYLILCHLFFFSFREEMPYVLFILLLSIAVLSNLTNIFWSSIQFHLIGLDSQHPLIVTAMVNINIKSYNEQRESFTMIVPCIYCPVLNWCQQILFFQVFID